MNEAGQKTNETGWKMFEVKVNPCFTPYKWIQMMFFGPDFIEREVAQ